MLQSEGSSQPIGFFIADAPQGEDLVSNYALSGYSKSLLVDMLKGTGLGVNDFFRTALIKQELIDKSDIQSAENKALIPQYSQFLIDEINTLKPNLLIPLGELSFNYLTGLTGIRKFRGSVLLCSPSIGINTPIKVLPILGPYPFLFQEYKLRTISRIDFAKIPKYINDSPPPDNLCNIWVAKSSSALRTFLERSYKDDGLLVFDIETFMGIPSCISFCFDGFESVCIPLLDRTIDRDNRVLMLGLVSRVLASSIPKVNQNIKFDYKILRRWGLEVNNIVGDTAVTAGILYCEFPKNLGFLTSIYTDLPYFKDEGKEFDPEKYKKEQFYLYNAKDSLSTHQINTKQQEEVDELGVRFVHDESIKLINVYTKLEERGIRIDNSQRESLSAKYDSLFNIQVAKLKMLLSVDYINPLSSKKMNEVVFEELKFKKVRGVKGTDEESLLLLMAYSEAEHAPSTGKDILSCIINCRKIHKVIELLELPSYPDGRFRCEYNLSGTETGRTSASKSLDQIIYIDKKGRIKGDYLGHSLQTIGKHGFMIDGETYGKDVRVMFVPSPGYVFVECDLSQAEARVDAILANNFDILSVFDGPVGIHRLTGSWIYGCDSSDIKKNTLVDGVDRYHMAKTVRHAGERNMREDRLIAMTQCTMKVAKSILATFHKYQPEIRDVFHKEIMAAINATHSLRAPNGRRHDFFDRIDQHTYNQGISFIPQAIVSDQTKFSFDKIFTECPWAYLLNEQHDGSLAEVPIGRELEYGESYVKNVTTPIDFRNCSLSRDFELIIPCEISVGEDWYNMKDVKL